MEGRGAEEAVEAGYLTDAAPPPLATTERIERDEEATDGLRPGP